MVRGLIQIRENKSGKKRLVPMNAPVRMFLSGWKRKSENSVFPNQKKACDSPGLITLKNMKLYLSKTIAGICFAEILSAHLLYLVADLR